MAHDILSRIEVVLPELSRSEQRVARWVLDQPRAAQSYAIAAIAMQCDVSEPTVIRFCRSIGLAGVRALKQQLLAALQRPESYLHTDVAVDDDIQQATGKVMDSAIRALIDYRDHCNLEVFERIAQDAVHARQIVFAGLGASGIVAQDACHKFFRLGIPTTTALDVPIMLQRAAIAKRGDVFIACSNTGRWPELVRAMELAAQNDALVVAVTRLQTPLAKSARYVLECPSPEDTSIYAPMNSRLVQLAILDGLQVALALVMGERVETRLRASKEVLRQPVVDRSSAVPKG